MQKVDVGSVDGSGELRIIVETSFVFSPVVSGAPVVCKFFDIVEWNAVVPADVWQLVWPASLGYAVAQIINVRLGNCDLKGTNLRSLLDLTNHAHNSSQLALR